LFVSQYCFVRVLFTYRNGTTLHQFYSSCDVEQNEIKNDEKLWKREANTKMARCEKGVSGHELLAVWLCNEGTVIILGLLPLASNCYFSKEVPKHYAMEFCRRCEGKFCSSESQRETYDDLV